MFLTSTSHYSGPALDLACHISEGSTTMGARRSIQTQLLLAFTLVTSFTVLASIVASLSYRSLSGKLLQIESRSLPRQTQLLSLSRQASAMSSLLAGVAIADSPAELRKALGIVLEAGNGMRATLTTLSGLSDSLESSHKQTSLADELYNSALVIGDSVAERLDLRSKRLETLEQAVAAHRAMYEKIVSISDDANFYLTMKLKEGAESRAGNSPKATLIALTDNELPTLIALSDLRAETNLIIGILSEISLVPDRTQLVPLKDRLLTSTYRARRALASLAERSYAGEVGLPLNRLLAFADSDSIITLRDQELSAYEKGWRLVRESLTRGEDLASVAEEAAGQSRIAVSREIAASNSEAVADRVFLAFMSIGSVGTLIGAFLFIRQNITRRLYKLIRATRSIAAGNLTVKVPIQGHDELAHLGAAVETFKANSLKLLELEAEQSKALALAQNAVKARSELLSNMSHELRTPMHAILSYSKRGLTKINNNEIELVEKYFKNIYTSGTRLLGLLNNLLDLAKLESGKMGLRMQPGQFLEVIEQTLVELEPLITDRNARTAIDVTAKSTDAIFDKQRMIQVMVNIISNAVKFSPPAGKIQISFESAELPDGREALCCSVADNGAGIPETELEAVFDKFVQSSKTKTGAGGTGLGLAICREIILAHEGKIWAENVRGGGAAIKFLFPRKPFPGAGTAHPACGQPNE